MLPYKASIAYKYNVEPGEMTEHHAKEMCAAAAELYHHLQSGYFRHESSDGAGHGRRLLLGNDIFLLLEPSWLHGSMWLGLRGANRQGSHDWPPGLNSTIRTGGVGSLIRCRARLCSGCLVPLVKMPFTHFGVVNGLGNWVCLGAILITTLSTFTVSTTFPKKTKHDIT